MQTINNLLNTHNYFPNSRNNKVKQPFINPVKTLRVLAISSMLMAGTIAAHAQVKVGANPANITTNAVLDVEGSSAQRTVILQNGNMGVNQAVPTNKLHVKDAANPARLEGLQVSTNAANKSVVVDANGVLKTSNSGVISSFVIYALNAFDAIRTAEGNTFDILNEAILVNDIPGASYNQGNNMITIPSGTYIMTFSLNAHINDATVTAANNINSYFFQFPTVTSSTNTARVHGNSPSVNGIGSSHGTTISYVGKYTGPTTVKFALGWGQGGTVESGKKITVEGAQLSIVRIAD